jgi:thiamine biosynthesis protein ThiS
MSGVDSRERGAELIELIVNGEPRRVAAGISVRGLVEEMGLAKAACAVEVNRGIVPRREHEARVLAGGDVVEVVSLVGGG